MLISSHKDQNKQVIKNTFTLLARIAETVKYIDIATAQIILGMTRPGATKYLKRATRWGLLKSHKVEMMNMKKRQIFGLTLHGIEWIKTHVLESDDHYFFDEFSNEINFPHEEKIAQLSPWSINRFRPSAHNHEMFIVLAAEALKEKVKIIYPRYYAYKKRKSDLSIEMYDGSRLAIEVELTIKSKKRYEKILWAYRKHFEYYKNHHCIWITETISHARRLSKILDLLEKWKRNHHRVFVYYEHTVSVVDINNVKPNQEFIEQEKMEMEKYLQSQDYKGY